MSKTLKLVVPEDVIEKAVDDYLESIFGRQVIWQDGKVGQYRYLIEVMEYFDAPLEIDFEEIGLEDEW